MNRVIGGVLILWIILFFKETGMGVWGSQILTSTGMLLIFAYLAGKTGKIIRLPQITGYLLLGIIVGPSVTGLFTQQMVDDLQIVNQLAVSMIALTAGAEIQVSWLKKRAKTISWVLIWQNVILFFAVGGLMFLLRNYLPFMTKTNLMTDVLIAIVLGTFAVASSPSVAVAIISETRSSGPVTQTILGVTVLKDVGVIILFTIALTIGKAASGASLEATPVIIDLLRETFGSMILGIIIGLLMALYIKKIGQEIPLVLISTCFLIAELGLLLHTEPLLTGMTAGFFLRNTQRGAADMLVHGLENLSLPVYCLFFGLAGLSLSVGTLPLLGHWALLLVVLRLVFLYIGTSAGAKFCKAEPEIQKYAWLGFVSQAGVTLAMASIVAKAFPSWGQTINMLTITVIAMNQLFGPVLLKIALSKSGETRVG